MSNVNKRSLVWKAHLPQLSLSFYVFLLVSFYLSVYMHVATLVCAHDHAVLTDFHAWIAVIKQILCPPTLWQEGIRNKPSKAFVVRKTDLSGKVNANWHTLSLSRLHIPRESVTTDRWWQNREVGCSKGAQGGTIDAWKEKWGLTLRWQSNPSVQPISHNRISARIVCQRYHP